MKRALFLAGILAVFALAQEPAVPRKAPALGIQTGPEKYLWLSDYAGKTCVVAFISTSCPHCQYTVGVLNKIAKDYADKNVQILASAIDPMSSLYIPEFKQKFTPAFPVGYNDEKYAATFLGFPPNDPMFVPQIVMVDKGGVIRAQIDPEDPSMNKDIQEKSLREALERTLKGQATPRPATPK